MSNRCSHGVFKGDECFTCLQEKCDALENIILGRFRVRKPDVLDYVAVAGVRRVVTSVDYTREVVTVDGLDTPIPFSELHPAPRHVTWITMKMHSEYMNKYFGK